MKMVATVVLGLSLGIQAGSVPMLLAGDGSTAEWVDPASAGKSGKDIHTPVLTLRKRNRKFCMENIRFRRRFPCF